VPVIVLSSPRLTPATGAIVLTGFAPVLIEAAATNIPPLAGVLTLTGYAPVISQTGLGIGTVVVAETVSLQPVFGTRTLQPAHETVSLQPARKAREFASP
jgi:hypothetical protein